MTEFLADWDWGAMSSLTALNAFSAPKDGAATPHIVWDTQGVSVQGWSGYTAYALDVLVGSSVEHRFVGPGMVLSRLDDVLKTGTSSSALSVEAIATAGVDIPAGARAYSLLSTTGDTVVLLARAEIRESTEPAIRLRVVLWGQTSDANSTVTSVADLTMDQMGPKSLMEDISGAFGESASSIDGLSTASIVAASKGQAVSVILKSRFLWWFTAFAMALSLMFVPVIVMSGDLTLSGAATLATVLVTGSWGLVTTRRNWGRRSGR